MPHDTESATAAAKERVAARSKKQKEHLARLSAPGRTGRRCFVGAVTPMAPGFGGHGDRSSGEDSADIEIGPLIPDPEVFRDLNISAMTGWRWDRDVRMAELGWPAPIYRGRYKFRDSNQYRKFKANLVRQAIAKRNTLLGQTVKEEGAIA
jgi:hypothetical protein